MDCTLNDTWVAPLSFCLLVPLLICVYLADACVESTLSSFGYMYYIILILTRCVGRRNYVYFFALSWCGTIQYSCSGVGSLLLLTAWADHDSVLEAAAAVDSVGVWRFLMAVYIALVRLFQIYEANVLPSLIDRWNPPPYLLCLIHLNETKGCVITLVLSHPIH